MTAVARFNANVRGKDYRVEVGPTSLVRVWDSTEECYMSHHDLSDRETKSMVDIAVRDYGLKVWSVTYEEVARLRKERVR